MKLNVKDEIGYVKPLLIISFLTVAFSALGAIFGELFAAVASGLIACIFVFENKGRRIFSFTVPVLVVGISFAVGGWFSVIGIETVAFGAIVYVCISRGYRKSTCSAVITATAVFFALLTVVLLGIKETGQVSIDALTDYYTSVYENIREQFAAAITEAFNEVEKMYSAQIEAGQLTLPTREDAISVFDSFLDVIISVAVIFGFFISGITLKVFSAVSLAITDKPIKVASWRFGTGNLFAVFYGVIYFAGLFISSYDSVVALTVVNLHTIFLAVYAYVGFRSLYASLRLRYSGLVCWSIIIVSLILLVSMFGSMMTVILDILSVFGIMMTISSNKYADGAAPHAGDGDNNN